MNKCASILVATVGVFVWGGAGCLAANPFPAGDAAWTVEIERDETAVPKSSPVRARPVRYDVQRMGNARLDRITFSDGGTALRWWHLKEPKLIWETDPKGADFFYSQGEVNPATVFDETTFRWMKGLEAAGEERWKGRNCLVFRGEDQDGERSKNARTAWVDKETGMILGLRTRNVTAVFTFPEEIPRSLVLPDKLLERIERARKILGAN